MGPSGSGKSTLLNIIGCLDRPSGGSYRLDGHEVGQLDDEELTRIRREQIGFVFQFFHLVPRLTAAGNVELPLLFGGVARAERRQPRRRGARLGRAAPGARTTVPTSSRAASASGSRSRAPSSTGPRSCSPTSPPATSTRSRARQILELLDRLNEDGLTLVVVTHDPNVARRADRVIVMVDGKVARRMKGSEVPAIVVT